MLAQAAISKMSIQQTDSVPTEYKLDLAGHAQDSRVLQIIHETSTEIDLHQM